MFIAGNYSPNKHIFLPIYKVALGRIFNTNFTNGRMTRIKPLGKFVEFVFKKRLPDIKFVLLCVGQRDVEHLR